MIKNVEKRDGKLEKFDLTKIEKVVIAAGLLKKDAQKLLRSVNSWAKETKEETVSSLTIRDKILNELKKLDEYAAKQYEWYENLKGKEYRKS